jgi:hypothetical protein
MIDIWLDDSININDVEFIQVDGILFRRYKPNEAISKTFIPIGEKRLGEYVKDVFESYTQSAAYQKYQAEKAKAEAEARAHEDSELKMCQKEREDVIKFLRSECEEYGDLDWTDDLHLVDILDKHLLNYLETFVPKKGRAKDIRDEWFESATRALAEEVKKTTDETIAKQMAEIIRMDERTKVWKEISKLIEPGELKGNGCDKAAQRNGIIRSANLIANMGINREVTNG